MFHSLFYNCKKVYLNSIHTMVAFSGTTGLLTGFGNYKYDFDNKKTTINFYTYMIGYISIGILSGVAYPISFPLCTYHLYTSKILPEEIP